MMSIQSFLKKIKQYGFLILIGFSIIFGLVLVYRRVISPRATRGVPQLLFDASPLPLSAGGDFQLNIETKPNGGEFHAFELYFTYDPEKVEFQTADDPKSDIESPYSLVEKKVDRENNLVTITGAKTEVPFSGEGKETIATIKMRVKEGAEGKVRFAWDERTKIGARIEKELVDSDFSIGTGQITEGPTEKPKVTPSISITPPSARQGARLYFSSQKTTYNWGENFDLEINLDTQGNQVKSTDIVFYYDPDILGFQNEDNLIENIILNKDSGFDTDLALRNIDRESNQVSIGLQTRANQEQPPVNGDVRLATVTFKIKEKDGVFTLRMAPSKEESNVYNLETQNILTDTPTYVVGIGELVTIAPTIPQTTGEPPVTETPPPPGEEKRVTFNLILKFQGIIREPVNHQMAVKVTLRNFNTKVKKSKRVIFYYDGKVSGEELAKWKGTVTLKIPYGQGYLIYIKGPRHLQKKICHPYPLETYPGTYRCSVGKININSSSESFDFSRIYQLVGDLPDQDGIVNSYDIALVRNNLGSTDGKLLEIADMNLDGIVDSQDYSLLIAALSIRYDEE